MAAIAAKDEKDDQPKYGMGFEWHFATVEPPVSSKRAVDCRDDCFAGEDIEMKISGMFASKACILSIAMLTSFNAVRNRTI